MKKLILVPILLLATSALFAQNISFRVEKDFVQAGGEIVTADTPGMTVLSSLISPAAFDSLSFSAADPAAFIADLQALATNEAFVGGWVPVPKAGGPIASTSDWNLSRLNLSVGLSPVLLITTSELGALGPTDFVGLVSSTSVVPAVGSLTVNFTGDPTWDKIALGSMGSFNLVAVPEPSHFALGLGVLGLGFVLWRRRR